MNGKRNGNGKEYHMNNILKFEGIYFNDKEWEGKGYDTLNNIAYELKEGKGLKKEYLFNGKLIFEGEYLNGLRNGKGKEYGFCYNDYNENDLIFEGEYLNGFRHGKGKQYYENKLIFEGEYLYGYKLRGKFFINDILEYEGEYILRKYNGKGYDKNGNIIYELKNGKGTIKEYDNYDELIYEGEYLNEERNQIKQLKN